mmetsp:Transcript_25078/g.30358  ORF Transcript_25078/g.30358 Transcript_25078/m.30358 type:complete len:261 (+) Transcript_25078:89-871(+)|eukprot:CAMPEP_0197858432 /NCGR_PEP_ID=MMETSP1438-20131217/32234_1 /TAXON_ID=1461541 /ORGANISM="Pterosperma sp., Strain CCMP1384" /LENGTH=260 /DNA_ID=CAMNT_0043474589 /DNA_START=80 /DNA_END=862 /DNA_ORIENTATION=-
MARLLSNSMVPRVSIHTNHAECTHRTYCPSPCPLRPSFHRHGNTVTLFATTSRCTGARRRSSVLSVAAGQITTTEDDIQAEAANLVPEVYNTIRELLTQDDAERIIAADEQGAKTIALKSSDALVRQNWEVMTSTLSHEEAGAAAVKHRTLLWFKDPPRMAQNVATMTKLFGSEMTREIVLKVPLLLLSKPAIIKACWAVIIDPEFEETMDSALALVRERPWLLRAKLYPPGGEADARVGKYYTKLNEMANEAAKKRAGE